MTVPEILALIDSNGFADTSTVDKMSLLNQTYYDVCGREEWPFLEAVNSSLATTVSQATISSIPANIREIEAVVNTSTGRTLTPERYDILLKSYSSTFTQTGEPRYYAFIAHTLQLFPLPDAAYNLTLVYLVYPTPLLSTDVEATILVPPRHHQALVEGTLAKLYKLEDDMELSMASNAEFEKVIMTMKDDLFRRTSADRADRIYVVDEWDDLDGWGI